MEFRRVPVRSDDSRQPVEATGAGDGSAGEIGPEGATRCVTGTNVLVTTVTNEGSDDVTATVTTPYGRQDLTVAEGSRVSAAFTTREAELPAGEVTAEVDGAVTTAAFPAASCG